MGIAMYDRWLPRVDTVAVLHAVFGEKIIR
jgi:hypothetical protein